MSLDTLIQDHTEIMMTSNFWNEDEYNGLLKLLLHPKNVATAIALLLKKTENTIKVIPPPISIELQLTNQCDLECSWCIDKKIRYKNDKINKNHIFKILDYCAGHDVGVTIEGGGEPSLHEDFEKIINYGASLGVHMGLFSNGVKNFSHLIHKFKWIRISLDSSTKQEYLIEKGKDRFFMVLDNLRDFSLNREPKETYLGVGYVLTRRNMGNIAQLMEILNEMGVDYVYFRPVEEAPEILPTIDQLLSLKLQLHYKVHNMRLKYILRIHDRLVSQNDQLPCVSHLLSCIIHADGDVVLCEKRQGHPIILGNITKELFELIWNSIKHKHVSKRLCDPSEQKECSICRMTYLNRAFIQLINLNPRFI